MTDSALHSSYVKELYTSLGYFGTWLPTVTLQLGDIMTFGSAGLTRVGHLRDHGLVYTARSGTTGARYEYASSGAVSVTSKLAGELVEGSALAQGDAGVVVTFSKEKAVLFEADDCTISSIADVDPLGRSIEKRYSTSDWDQSWLVITEIVAASAATIIISSGREARADIKVDGRVQAGSMKLANLKGSFETKHTSNIGLKIISSAGLVPLFRASGIKRSLLGMSARFRPRSSASDPEGAAFGALAPDDIV